MLVRLLVAAGALVHGACAQKSAPAGRSSAPPSSRAPAQPTTPPEPAPPVSSDTSDLREGDIVFQTSRSSQSEAIQIATRSRFSHMGIVRIDVGTTFVFEAIGPVKLTPLEDWIDQGEGKHFVAMRLKDANQRLTPEALAKMRTVEVRFDGRPYDSAFGWSDDRLYCSELVWKVYKRALGIELAKLQRLGDFDLSHPTVREKVRERYGGRVPVDEPVISPGAIAESPLLVKVVER